LPIPPKKPPTTFRHKNWFNEECKVKVTPTNKSFTGIFLDPSSATPKFVQVPLKEWHDNGEDILIPDIDPFLLMNHGTFSARNWLHINPITKKNLSNTLCFEYREDFLSNPNGSEPNKWIDNFQSERRLWRGPVLIYKLIGTDLLQDVYADINEEDFKNIVDFFVYSYKYLNERISNGEPVNIKFDFDNEFKHDFGSLNFLKPSELCKIPKTLF